MDDTVYVVIEGEPFLSRARAYRDEMSAHARAWSAFAEQHGAEGYVHGYGLCFRRDPPEGWTKPSGRHKASRPKKGTDALAELEALPKHPTTWAVFGDALIYQLKYTDEASNGMVSLGFFWHGPSIGWTADNDFVAVIPHAGRAAAAMLKDHPTREFANGALTWQTPDGLREVSKAEKELIFAEAAVRAERASKAA